MYKNFTTVHVNSFVLTVDCRASSSSIFKTRMHPSRMHTVCNRSRLGGGGGGGCLLSGGGVPAPGVISQHALMQTPSVDRHTGVKT